jgi:gliding motility-associated-like protein
MSERFWYSLIVFFLVAFTGMAQSPYPSNLGRFQVDQKLGCAPLTVNVSMRPGFACDGSNPCDMDFGDGAGFQNLTFSHTYTQPGTYTLTVLIQSLDPIDKITITVLPNTPPQFDVFACENNEVSVLIPDMTYDRYFINFNDGSSIVNVLKGNAARANHVYATSGAKTVTVRGEINNAAANCNPATKNITVFTTMPTPTISLLQVLDNSSLSLNFNAQNGIQYRLEIGQNSGTSFQLLRTIFNVTTETVVNLRTDDNFYCFRLGAFDPCNNRTVYSNVICSSNFDLTVGNNVINSLWTTSSTGVSIFRVGKVWDAGGQTVSDNASPYGDTEINCGTEYCYTITTNYTNGSRSVSLTKCATAISTDIPDPVENISSVVSNPGVNLEWLSPSGFAPAEFKLFKSASSTPLTTTTQVNASDETYTTAAGGCYRISYIDVCGNQSELSSEACPIQLTGILQGNNNVTLNWTSHTGWKDGVSEYIVEKYSEQGQLLQTFNPGAAITLIDEAEDLNQQTVVYLVRAISADAAISESVSNRLVIVKNPNLFYPTAFTPNGDNLNDVFNVYGQFITEFEMNIFNRWGELLFTTKDLTQGWDGTYRGNAMPEGTYTFVATITDRKDRTFKKSGTVVLLRKGK